MSGGTGQTDINLGSLYNLLYLYPVSPLESNVLIILHYLSDCNIVNIIIYVQNITLKFSNRETLKGPISSLKKLR